MTTKKEAVDHPAHYQGKGGMEAIDVIEAFDLGFNLGNAVNYILRAGRKTVSKEGKLEDLQKGTWYLDRAIADIKKDAADVPRTTTAEAEHIVATRIATRASKKKPKLQSSRRDPDVLAKLRQQLRDFILKNPGLRIEQINAKLGTKTKDVALPLHQLVASKVIASRGEKRATTYHAPPKKK